MFYDLNRFLLDLFRTESNRVHGMHHESMLELFVKAGLCALKTPVCCTHYEEDGKEGDDSDRTSDKCPVCMPEFSSLSKLLPLPQLEQSRLICFISGEVMNEDNPPMVLPNNHVYSKEALLKLVDDHDRIQCPRTGETFNLTAAKKVFIF